MPPKKRPTHRDVAQLAGVSPGVVSYVINNGPRPTSPQVRERVLRAIDELGYRPNVLGRNLRSQRTNMIGYIFSDYVPRNVFTSTYSATILAGIVEEVKAREHYLMVYPVGIDESLAQLEQLLTSGLLDSVVVRLAQDPPHTNPLMAIIDEAGLPCVCIERPCDPQFNYPSVTYDDAGGAYAATRFLVAQGHRRIAHLRGDLHYPSARLRLQGYKQALIDAQLPID
ncbi:MAG: LacI family DNA-binding transcriptional regulator, partial [Chloroflexota bacterium]